VNFSEYDNTLERGESGNLAMRLGFRQADGMREDDSNTLVAKRGGGYLSIDDMRKRGISSAMLRRLADADAFGSLKQGRREAVWEVRRLPADDVLPLFSYAHAPELGEEPQARLPRMQLGEHVTADYQTTRVSLKGHPMEILRPVFEGEGVLSCAQTTALHDGRLARTAGVILVRQRPGTGKAIFITLEDETGIVNVVLWARTFEKFRAEAMASRLLLVEGRVQKSREGVTHLMGARLIDRTAELERLSETGAPEVELSPADEFAHPQYPRGMNRHPRNVRILPKSRDFH
jgi:error-prone DNA polymerase